MIVIDVETRQRTEFVDITGRVQEAAEKIGLRDGVLTLFAPHTTAGVTINENADPDVVADICAALERMVPWRGGYRHAEGNSAAHVKAGLLGSSARVIVRDGRLMLGTWQAIYLAEFDGPRRRSVWVA